MNTISIRDLEQRIKLDVEVIKLEESLLDELLIVDDYYNNRCTYNFYLDRLFTDFPYSGTSRDLDEFFHDRGIAKNSSNYYLTKLNFYSNFLSWFYSEYNESLNFNINNLALIIKRIDFILNHVNYKNVEDKEENEFNFKYISTVKRDVDVDSILRIIERDLAVDILSYLDFENEDNLKFKESIMARLYKDLESKKKDLDMEPNRGLYSDTKFALNISRHHSESKLPVVKRIEICDKAFYLYIHLVRSSTIKQFQMDISELKSK